MISEILKTEGKPPTKSVFKFENTKQASKHNAKILKTFNYDYEMVLEKQKGTNIYYGSEFCYYKNLEKLLKYHNSWDKFKTFLSSGTDTVLSELDNKTLQNDCLENMKRGNHESASKSKDVLDFVNKQYNKEVSKGSMCWDYLLPTLYMSIQPDKLGFIQYIYDKYEYIICINVFTLIIYRYMLSCISTYGLST